MEKYIRLTPIKKTAIWGSESWVIAAHENGDALIQNGAWKGRTLGWLWQNHREYFANMAGERFPLLIKEIIAESDLSIQVHPDNEYARKHEQGASGKNECWYILEAKPNASLIMGHNARNKAEAENYIQNGQWNKFLKEVPVNPGDFFQIDAGCIHSIKGGIRLLEVQQNSDITYRLYDYDRLDQYGRKRPLHLKKSLDVITFKDKKIQVPPTQNLEFGTKTVFVETPYYHVEKYDITEGEIVLDCQAPFLCVSILDGTGFLDSLPLMKGMNLLLPHQCHELTIKGNISLLLTFPPYSNRTPI